MDFPTTIRLAQQIEELAGDLYRALAERSPADAPILRRLEQEEREHAKRLAMLGSMYLKDPRAFRGATFEIPGLEAIAREAKSFHDAVVGGRLDVARAFERLVELEERFGVTHAEAVARAADPGVRQLFALLASQDRAHIQLLRTRSVTGR